jgi:hypothetical protein
VFVTISLAAEIVKSSVTVRLPPTTRLPKLQITVPLASLQPGKTESKIRPAGTASVMLTPLAAPGPLLLTVIV